jgi:hypothetical protein
MLYPNPTKGSFTLQLPQGINAADVRISNISGAFTYSGRVTNNKVVFNLEGLPAGVYTVSVTSGDQTWHSNLIVK